jgi:crossover junction endodeoxyribonuclease RuvC
LKVIGIDPGVTATGYGILEDGTCICIGTIRPREKNSHNRIHEICGRIKQLLEEVKPDSAALEKVFYHKNIQSLIRSSELRGAIILTLLEYEIPIDEYAATQIKLVTTGNGRASKEQVRYIVEKTLLHEKGRTSNHAIDATAIAYTAVKKNRRKGGSDDR